MAVKKTSSLEVASDQITGQLIEIKDRISALETISTLANRGAVESWVKDALKSGRAKEIMRLCKDAKTRESLRTQLALKSDQAVDHHLNPLRDEGLLQLSTDLAGRQTFGWSNLFSRLPKKNIESLLL